MTPDQTAVLFKVALDSAEHHIEAMPEGDQKATAVHHATRIHHYLSELLKIAHGSGMVTTMSPVDKPPGA